MDPQIAQCCMDHTNRVTVAVVKIETGLVREHQRCGICHRNHYTVEVPPVPIGIAGREVV